MARFSGARTAFSAAQNGADASCAIVHCLSFEARLSSVKCDSYRCMIPEDTTSFFSYIVCHSTMRSNTKTNCLIYQLTVIL